MFNNVTTFRVIGSRLFRSGTSVSNPIVLRRYNSVKTNSSRKVDNGILNEWAPKPLSVTNVPITTQLKNFNWPYPDFRHPHLFWKIRSTFMIFVVGLWGKTVIGLMNRTKIFNKNRMVDAIFNRPKDTPLVTVSNHESCIDDPTLLAAFMTSRQLTNHKTMRWSLGAHDICYRKAWHGNIISLGKCAPVIRGLGVYQKAVDFAIERLNEGDWVHIFPEGRVNIERQEIYRLKWGIGRIISECQKPPIVIPFWHSGMADVLPNQSPYIPRWGKKVIINVGEPIDLTVVFEEIEGKTAIERRKCITDFIQERLSTLRMETLELKTKLNY